MRKSTIRPFTVVGNVLVDGDPYEVWSVDYHNHYAYELHSNDSVLGSYSIDLAITKLLDGKQKSIVVAAAGFETYIELV